MGESMKPRSTDYVLRSSSILRSVQAGSNRLSDLETATAMPQTTIVRVAAQLVEDNVLRARWIRGEVELSMAVRRFPDE